MVSLIKITINAFAYIKGNQKYNTYGYTDIGWFGYWLHIIITVVTQVIIYDTSLYNDEYVIYAVHELHAVYTY